MKLIRMTCLFPSLISGSSFYAYDYWHTDSEKRLRAAMTVVI